MNWLMKLTGTNKAVIAMCHLQALPGDPYYNKEKGMDYILEMASRDLHALQDGGVDAVMFSNEFSLPYLTDVKTVTVAAMADVIGQLKSEITVPFGVNVLWDAKKSLDLAIATGASFVREIFTGVYGSDFGLWNTNVGETTRHQHAIGAENVKLLFNIVPESAKYIVARDICEIARSTVFVGCPDALCVSGLTAGTPTDSAVLKLVKDTVPDTVVLANTGVNEDNYQNQLSIADGAVVGTFFKYDGKFENFVDTARVRSLMDKIKSYRKSL